MAGTETIVFYSAFLIWPGALRWLFPVMAGLVTVGVLQRLWWARRRLNAGAAAPERRRGGA